MFVILWEFEVKQGCQECFERVYGPQGSWVKLFLRDPHYRATHLLRDPCRPGVYFTLDFWDSESAYLAFKAANQDAYQQLDLHSEGLVLREYYIGSFVQRELGFPST
jgi:heme-degrading monooxygenase HmoA